MKDSIKALWLTVLVIALVPVILNSKFIQIVLLIAVSALFTLVMIVATYITIRVHLDKKGSNGPE